MGRLKMKPRANKWVVLLGGVYSITLFGAVMRCYSVFYEPLMKEYETAYTTISKLNAYFFLAYAGSNLVTPVVIKYLGYRITVMSSGMLAATSVLIASFLDDIQLIMILLSFIPGLCMSPITNSFLGMITKYSEKSSNFSIQLMMLGLSIGPFFSCPAFQLLYDEYSLRGTFMIVSGLFLNLTVAGTALFPQIPEENVVINSTKARIEEPQRSISKDTREKISSIDGNSESSTTSYHAFGFNLRQVTKRVSDALKLNIFTKKSFWIYSSAYGGSSIAYYSVVSYIVVYGTQVGTLSEMLSSTLISALSAGDAISKILHALAFASISRGRRIIVLALTVICVGFLMLLFTAVKGYPAMMAVCAMIGLAGGGITGCITVTISTEFPPDLFVHVNSYSNVLAYLMSMAGQFIIGVVIDSTKNIASAFYIGFGGSLYAFLAPLIFYKLTEKRRR